MQFKPMPKRREVHSGSPDGLYLDDRGDWKQIIIVGPHNLSPGDIEQEFDDFEINEVTFLRTDFATPNVKRVIMRRGFVSVILCRYPSGRTDAN